MLPSEFLFSKLCSQVNYHHKLFIFRFVTITEAQFCMVWYHGEMDALGVAPLVSIRTSILQFHGLIKLLKIAKLLLQYNFIKKLFKKTLVSIFLFCCHDFCICPLATGHQINDSFIKSLEHREIIFYIWKVRN